MPTAPPASIERFSYRTSSSKISNKTKKTIYMVLIILLLIVLGFLIYKAFGNKSTAQVYYF